MFTDPAKTKMLSHTVFKRDAVDEVPNNCFSYSMFISESVVICLLCSPFLVFFPVNLFDFYGLSGQTEFNDILIYNFMTIFFVT